MHQIHSPAQHRLLIVDDDKELLTFYEESFLETGQAPLLASSAEEAISLFKKNAPFLHLLLTDYQMPGNTGLWLATQVAAIKKIPMILITGRVPEKIKTNLFTEVLLKPVQEKTLRGLLHYIQ